MYLYRMTVIELQIPDDLEPALKQVSGDKQQFILDAVRRQLSDTPTEADIETATATDLSDELLTQDELTYYLNLPDVSAR